MYSDHESEPPYEKEPQAKKEIEETHNEDFEKSEEFNNIYSSEDITQNITIIKTHNGILTFKWK